MKDVVDKQIPELESNQDAITLSIGISFKSITDDQLRILQLIPNFVQVVTMSV